MSEEQQEQAKEETKEQSTSDNTGEGVQPKAVTDLDRADSIAERQKRENDRRENLLQREEALEARRKVGGVTNAGEQAPKPKEETDEDYHEKFMKGEANPFK